MARILLLYDTKEKDLARDLGDFLGVLDLDVVMIPLSPDKGKTLQEKERHYFSDPDGAIFLITPGSDRDGKPYPSPSVTDEMGQAKAAFSKTPERVIYLVQKPCNIQAVDQRCYIDFDRGDIRSVIEVVTRMVRNLIDSGLYGKKKVEPQATPKINVPEFSKEISDNLKAICEALSEKPDGVLESDDFDLLLRTTFEMTTQAINFAKRDLQTNGLVTYSFYGSWRLLPLGFDVVRHEIGLRLQKKREEFEKRALGGGVEDVFKTREGLIGQTALDPKNFPRPKK